MCMLLLNVTILLYPYTYFYFNYSFNFVIHYSSIGLTVFTVDTVKCYRKKYFTNVISSSSSRCSSKEGLGRRLGLLDMQTTPTHWSDASYTMRSAHVSSGDNYSALVWLGCLNMIWNITSGQLYLYLDRFTIISTSVRFNCGRYWSDRGTFMHAISTDTYTIHTHTKKKHTQTPPPLKKHFKLIADIVIYPSRH